MYVLIYMMGQHYEVYSRKRKKASSEQKSSERNGFCIRVMIFV